MAGSQHHTDLTVGLEAADAGPMTGAGIDDHKRAFAVVDFDALGGVDLYKPVVDGFGQRSAGDDKVVFEIQHVRDLVRHVIQVLISALAKRIPKQYRSLAGVESVFCQLIVVK